VFTAGTLQRLEGMTAGDVDSLGRALASPRPEPLSGWRVAGLACGFAGFDGSFAAPPVLLEERDAPSRHRFRARSGGVDFRIDADAFGWVCRPVPVEGLLPAVGSGNPEHPSLRRATSWVHREDAIAFTTEDSFRIRILAPARQAV